MHHLRRTDLTTLALCTVLLAACLGAAGTAGRERAKRAVCLSNLKQLTEAWRLYTEDYNGHLVNGMAGINRSDAQAWVGQCWQSDYYSGGQLPETRQNQSIQDGALWSYLEALNLYRCPSGYAGEMLTYAIVDSMNGLSRVGTAASRAGVRIDDTVLWVQNLDEIITPGPAQRMVFIDNGWVTVDSFAVHYQQQQWWEGPPVHHNDGTTVSFADGHCEHWRWQGADTIRYGKESPLHYRPRLQPETAAGCDDLHRLQRAVWGRLGYEPTAP